MSTGEKNYRAVQAKARSDTARRRTATPTGEYLTRHALESFLFRLTRTEHADAFVLKGGLLLAAYGVRRPTKDVDAEAVSASVEPEQMAQVVRDIAAVGATHRHDPRLLGADIEITGYHPETVLAEKGVTFLERGITSTRWRDYVDIVQLATNHTIDHTELRRSAEAVAQFRRVDLKPTSPVVENYGDTAQNKWAAWRRKEGFEEISAENLDDQMAQVADILDPVFWQAPNTSG